MPGIGKLRSGKIDLGNICEERITDDDSIECAWVMLQTANPTVDKTSEFGGIDMNPCSPPYVYGLNLREAGEAPASRQPVLLKGPLKLHDISVYGQLNFVPQNTICFNYLVI